MATQARLHARRRRAGGAAPRASRSATRPGAGVILPARTSAGQRGVHRLHADAGAGLHHRVDLVGLALADQVAHGRAWARAPRQATQRPEPSAVGQQLLGHDALQGDRELHADLVLLVGREDVDDAVDRLRRVLRVQRGEDEVAGLGRGQRGARSSPGRASRRRGSRRGPGAARPSGRARRTAASEPSSRWLTMHFLWPCRNSIGSSIVMMCSSRVSLISSIIAASEVDLPEPVGPVTSTKPRGFLVNSWTTRRQAELVDRRRSRPGSGGRRRRCARRWK